MEQSFRGPQACQLAGITYRQLDYWARISLVVPSVKDTEGSGRPRAYSYGDVLKLKVLATLLDAGMSLHSARRALNWSLGARSVLLSQSPYVSTALDLEGLDRALQSEIAALAA